MLITVLLIDYSLAGLGSTVRGSQNTSTSTLSPPPLSSDASGAAGRPLQSFLFAGRRFVLPTPHRCVLPSTACSLVRPFVSSRILPQTPVVASVLSYLFLLSSVTSVSLSLHPYPYRKSVCAFVSFASECSAPFVSLSPSLS